MRSFVVVAWCLTLLLSVGSSPVRAAGEFGLVFDVQGNVEIGSSGGAFTKLTRNQHLLLAIREGDTIRVRDGRLVIVSMKENRAYEMASGFQGIIRDNKLAAIKGKADHLAGLRLPSQGLEGPIGGFVVRGVTSCIKALAPTNTWIIELTPEFQWENTCGRGRKVTLKVIAGDSVLFSTDVEGDAFRLREGVLRYGEDYRWVVDAGGAHNVGEGRFTVHEKGDAERIGNAIAYYSEKSGDLSLRLSCVYYLLREGMRNRAQTELAGLVRDFPGNEQIRDLLEKVK